MYRLKSIFLSTAIAYWLFASIWSVYYGISEGVWYFGLLFTSLIPAIFIGQLFLIKTPRTSANLKPVSFLVVGSLALQFEQLLNNQNTILAFELALISLILWFVYLGWYSKFPSRDSEKLKLGSKMPKLQFIGVDGEKISTDKFKGKKLIYLFYRGNWCPLCMAQIDEISEQYKEIHALNAEVLLISPQPHKFTKSLAKKKEVDFQFLRDEDSKVAKDLGIFVKGGTPFGLEVLGFDSDTVMPTVIITDENRRILFADQTDNYRVRPEPKMFLEVLRKL